MVSSQHYFDDPSGKRISEFGFSTQLSQFNRWCSCIYGGCTSLDDRNDPCKCSYGSSANVSNEVSNRLAVNELNIYTLEPLKNLYVIFRAGSNIKRCRPRQTNTVITKGNKVESKAVLFVTSYL